ncbi:hypothetical protein [Nocardiopsis coralliicola]
MDGVDYAELRLALWEDPAQRAELTGWVESRLTERGRELLPVPPHVRVRPWSSTARFATSHGDVWFKAVPDSGCEAALVGALPSWVPGRVLQPLGVDAKRGWILLPDGGPTVLEHLDGRGTGSAAAWESVVAAYAHLQRSLADRVRDLFVLDVPDLRPSALPARIHALLVSLGAAEPGRELPELTAFRPELERLAGVLADSGVPESLDHTDLNLGNVVVRAGGYRFIDWGDAAVTHPFAGLAAPLERLAAGGPPDPAALGRLRDAYLEPWSDLAPLAALRAAVPAAVRLAAVSRALSWTRVFPELAPSLARAVHTRVQASLQRLTTDPLGSLLA